MDQVILSCIYGDKHTPLAYSFIYSALDVRPDCRIVIGYDNFPKFELLLLRIAFPTVNFVQLSSSAVNLKSHAAKASIKIRMWNQLFLAHLGDDELGAFLDIDTLILKSPFEGIPEVAQLFLTRKAGKWPLNTGVVFAKKSEGTRQAFSEWERETISILSSDDINRKAELISGGADQHSLIELLEISEKLRDETISSVVSDRFGIQVEFVPCSIYNQTESVPLDRNIKIVHFKAGWHKILLDSAPYSKNRPESSSSEMHSLWQATYFKANKLLYENLNLMAWRDKSIIHTVASINYEFRGIYNSELVLITSLFKSLGLSKILESGRARGHSTYVISKVLESTDNFFMVSVDLERNQESLLVERRLKNSKAVELLYGDSNQMLGKIIKSKKIGVGEDYGLILDGPKGLNAILLQLSLFALATLLK